MQSRRRVTPQPTAEFRALDACKAMMERHGFVVIGYAPTALQKAHYGNRLSNFGQYHIGLGNRLLVKMLATRAEWDRQFEELFPEHLDKNKESVKGEIFFRCDLIIGEAQDTSEESND